MDRVTTDADQPSAQRGWKGGGALTPRGRRSRAHQLQVEEVLVEPSDSTLSPTEQIVERRVWSRSVGYRMRLPTPATDAPAVSVPIDLKLPKLVGKSTQVAAASEVGSRSAFVVEMNTRVKKKLELLNSPRGSISPHKTQDRAKILTAVNEVGVVGMLGSNEEHAQQFEKGFGELRGQLKSRFAAPEEGGSGLWGNQTAQLVQPETVKPTKSPRQLQEERRELLKIQLEEYRLAKTKVAREIQERIERVRNDRVYAADFENDINEILQQRAAAHEAKYGDQVNHVETNATGLEELYSPRNAEERQQQRAALQRERMEAARERMRELVDAQAQRVAVDRHTMLMERRLEAEARAAQANLQSRWFMMLVLGATARAFGVDVQPKREERAYDRASLMIQLRIKLWVRRRKEKLYQETRDKLKGTVWLISLNRQIRLKRKGADILGPFLISAAQQGVAKMSVCLFLYRVKLLQQAYRKHYWKTQAQAELLLRQCQRDEKVLYPLAEGNVVMMMKGGGYEKHVPTDILWDTACRKIYERRREYVTQMRHFQEAEACQKEVETIQKVMAEADEIGAKLDAAAAGGEGPEQPLEQASMPIAVSPGRVLWVIVKFQRKIRRQLERYSQLGGVFTRRKSLHTMQIDLRLKVRSAKMDGKDASGPLARSLAATRALKLAIHSESLTGFTGIVLQRAEFASKAALSVRKKKKPKRISAIALMSIMSNKIRSRLPTHEPILTNMLSKDEVRATLESARRTMHQIDASDERASHVRQMPGEHSLDTPSPLLEDPSLE